jgi:lactobin A/cerein 7B family class IIb bacteriocin
MPQLPQVQDEQYLKMHKFFRSIPPGPISKSGLTALKTEIQKQNVTGLLKEDQVESVANLMKRVATEVEAEEWVSFCKKGELPPIKLTPEEMEMVRGGVVLTGAAVVGAAAATVVAVKEVWTW